MTTEKNNISLRDHFAGVALQGLLASPVMGDCALHDSAAEWVKEMTESAYDFADAMVAKRAEGDCTNPNLDISITELNLTGRVINCLHAEKIINVRDLIQYSERDLRKTPNLGVKSLCEIKEVLFERGLYLKEGQFWGWQREHLRGD